MSKMQPDRHMVAQIVVEEMMTWTATAPEAEVRARLYDLSERLIRYFSVWYATPDPLPGLPGGVPLGSPQ